MIGFTRKAVEQLEALRQHYEAHNRPEALRKLDTAVSEAMEKIERNPMAGLAAPRPYPSLAQPGAAWIKAGRYWVLYSISQPPVIAGIFYEAANIPRRL